MRYKKSILSCLCLLLMLVAYVQAGNRLRPRIGHRGYVQSMYPMGSAGNRYANASYVPYFADGVSIGNLPSSTAPWNETSGMTRSYASINAGYCWIITDATINPVRMRAISLTDASDGGIWTLTGSTGADIEDIGSANVGGQPYIYIADIGDNAAARTTVNIYRVKEPTITRADGSLAAGTDYDTIVCDYPASPAGEGATARRDAESLFVDPDTGDMYILTKRTTQVQVFRLSHAASYTGTQTLTSLGNMYQIPSSTNTNSTGNGGRAVGADISPNGKEIIVRSYSNLYHFARDKDGGQSIYTALTGTPTVLKGYVSGVYPSSAPNGEPQGEAVMFDHAGQHIYTASEFSTTFDSGLSTYPIFKYTRLGQAYTEVSFQEGVAPSGAYTGVSDTYLYSAAGQTAAVRGTETTFVCDWNATGTDERYGLLKFDLSTIPSSATIVGCDLTLFINTEGSILQVHKMLEAWTESTTRDTLGHMPALNDVQASSAYEVIFGDYALLTTGAGSPVVESIVLKMPVATVQAWVNGSVTNNGWLFYQLATVGGNGFQFRSSEHATTADRPKLTVRYTP